ncbi:hypothetical protein FRX31_026687 [Thalictrum thalictroides]|uniref:Reverse transcriptase zinc-binding domain-containing protein n=1 Tax=Thalictrum thalictroides TaxID=46969 RepID=A0A7J6VHM9_THATH|nr:hypothetical protein FRX31_026687 [Thalictrum thalictroides]
MNSLGLVVFEEGEYLLQWKWDKYGVFSVKTMYDQLKRREPFLAATSHAFPFNLVWRKPLPLNVKLFFWMMFLGKTLTVDNLNRKGQALSPICFMCKQLNESIPHIFLHCANALELWASLYVGSFGKTEILEFLGTRNAM